MEKNQLLATLIWVAASGVEMVVLLLKAENDQWHHQCPPHWCHTDSISWMVNHMKIQISQYSKSKTKPHEVKNYTNQIDQVQAKKNGGNTGNSGGGGK